MLALLHLMVAGMNSTRNPELQYLIQRTAPVAVQELDRAEVLARTF